MELMSSLLLCALALVPQALGKKSIVLTHEIGLNDSVNIKRTPSEEKYRIPFLQNPSLSSKVSDLQSVFIDPDCKNCFDCMERAIKSHKVHNRIDKIDAENFHDELVNQERNTRDKRKAKTYVQGKVDKKTKKSKSKRNKSITINKYKDNERIYALKIMETNTQVLSDQGNTSKSETCQVYSIRKSFPCESLQADLILKEPKRKINKKSKKEQSKRERNVSDAKTTVIAPVFRKRQIDESQVPEQIMPSIEEMY